MFFLEIYWTKLNGFQSYLKTQPKTSMITLTSELTLEAVEIEQSSSFYDSLLFLLLCGKSPSRQ
jgi:hypothetical protein